MLLLIGSSPVVQAHGRRLLMECIPESGQEVSALMQPFGVTLGQIGGGGCSGGALFRVCFFRFFFGLGGGQTPLVVKLFRPPFVWESVFLGVLVANRTAGSVVASHHRFLRQSYGSLAGCVFCFRGFWLPIVRSFWLPIVRLYGGRGGGPMFPLFLAPEGSHRAKSGSRRRIGGGEGPRAFLAFLVEAG